MLGKNRDSDAFELNNLEIGYRKRVRREKRLEALLRRLHPHLPPTLRKEVEQTLAMSWDQEPIYPIYDLDTDAGVLQVAGGVAPEPPRVGETWEWRDRGIINQYKLTRYDGSRWYGIGPWTEGELPLSLRNENYPYAQRFWRRIDT